MGGSGFFSQENEGERVTFFEKWVGVGRFYQKMGGSGLFCLKNGWEWVTFLENWWEWVVFIEKCLGVGCFC